MVVTALPAAPAAVFGARTDPARLAARLVRASVFAGAGVALALAAHLLGGGLVPQTRSLLLAAAVLWLAAVALTGRERGGRFLGVSVVVSQLGMHALFALTPRGGLAGSGANSTAIWARLLFCHDGPGSVSAAQVAAAKAGLGIAPGQLPPGGATGGAASGGVGYARMLLALAESGPMLGMLAAHLVAAGLMAWWLRRGERAAWAAGRRIVRAVAARIVVRPGRGRTGWGSVSAARPRTGYLGRRCERWWASALGTRGPPVAA